MLRIRALNEDSNSSGPEEHEPEVTKEAQETIACSEYLRALSLKRQGEAKAALNLFQELLETQVLNEVTDKTKKLFSIKYNCFRNACFLLEELGDKKQALYYGKEAVAMDDTDIYTLNKTGHLAVEFNETEYATYLFRRCQEYNPNHWPSADGMLQCACMHQDFMGAYGWAIHWHRRDETYERAIKVLVEVHEQFEPHIGLFEQMFRSKFDYEKFKHIRPEPSMFYNDPAYEPYNPNVEYKDISRFKVTELTWLTVGEWIINVYEECCDVPENLIRMHTWSELLIKEQDRESANQSTDRDNPEDGPPLAPGDDATAPSSQPTDASDSQLDDHHPPSAAVAKSSDETDSEKESNKQKKRRGSDLSFLEQWGWHKNRRHSRKRSMPAEPVGDHEDVTIATFLKQAFAKYYQVTFDPNESPFAPEAAEGDAKDCAKESEQKPSTTADCFKAPPTEQETDFQKLTQTEFDTFLNEFEYFDLIPLLYKWLEYTSSFWRMNVPPQIRQQYLKIYSFYWTHYGFQPWAVHLPDEFKQCFAMGLFYVEQVHEALQNKTATKAELLDDDFYRLKEMMMFHSGFYCLNSPEEFMVRICRYHWSNYLLAQLENNLEMCLQSLSHIVFNFEKQKAGPTAIISIKLPCKTQDAVIELELVRGLIKSLERTISLNNVGRLYADEKYKELIPILKDSLINCTTIKSADDSVMKLRTQFEILLECLWNVGDFEGCLVWSERIFKYCIDLYETIPEFSYRLKDWGAAINFILTYFEAILGKYSVDVLMTLGENQCRLIQNLVRIICHQLDTPVDKNNPEVHAVDLKTPWILLYLVRERDEVSNCPLVGVKAVKAKEETTGDSTENSHDEGAEEEEQEEEEHIPKSFLLLFTAHEYLGRKMWCTKDGGGLLQFTVTKVGPLLRTPMLEPFRDLINEYLEQVTYCLFAYPPKKARSRHIVEHDATQKELTWELAIDLFDIYRPDNVPEFDAYKVESISVDMEQLLQKILPLIPAHLDLSAGMADVKDFIKGRVEKLPDLNPPQFPHRIASIYYLIADYHFKNRDFTKPTKFYQLDLALHPWRFDSWAGLALSKATIVETRINQLTQFSNAQEFLVKCEDAIRCFETCLKLRDKHTMLWIEYGSFAYMLQSFCSRNLKQASETLSMEAFEVLETYKEKFMRIAYNCFHTVDLYLLEAARGKDAGDNGEEEEEESHDEKWLYHYMLGKVAEKKKDPPKVYLEHYLKASKYLYECNATYPYKINHSNPQNLSIEALEIFYRITSTILKYLEQHEVVTRDVGKLFERMFRELSTSPFTYNKAKLDNNSINALKRKMATQEEQEKKNKPVVEESPAAVEGGGPSTTLDSTPDVVEEKIEALVVEKKLKMDDGVVTATKVTSPSRRISQESTATSVTTTTTSRTTTTSSTSSSSSSSDSSSDDDDEDVNSNLTERELELIYGICVKNLEECLVRFPEHYKSMNRLVHHFLYAPEKLRNMPKARELLLSTYVTSMGTKVQGLFADRKGNNFFNGIWRIPSSEIDRPGSFAAHLSKAVILLLEVLKASSEYEVTFDLAVQLHKSPDPDKKYIKDSECKELLQQTLSCCCQSFRNILRKHATTMTPAEKRNDYELVNLILEVNKMYRKCIKQIPGKESCFLQVMVDVYKAYAEDKVRKLPEQYNVQDLAIKFCNYEINRRKNAEKGLPLGPVQLPGIPVALLLSSAPGNVPQGIPNLPRSTTISVAPPVTMSSDLMMGLDLGQGGMVQKPNVGKVANNNPGGMTHQPGAGASNAAGKPRGRPVGSKNVAVTGAAGPSMPNPTANASSAAMKQMMGNMDANTLKNMSALMSLYSNPSMQSDPDAMNKMIMEYYKMLLGSAAAPMAMSQLNQAAAAASMVGTNPPSKGNTGGSQKRASSSQAASSASSHAAKQQALGVSSKSTPTAGSQYQQQPSSATAATAASNAPKSMPKYDMSTLIQSAASNILKDPVQAMTKAQQQQLQQMQQNTISLGGGQLTITPSTVPKQQQHHGKGKKSASSEDAAQKMMKKSYLPDLPKSLTITASGSAQGVSGGGGGGGVGNPGGSGSKGSSNQNKQNPKPTVTMSKVQSNVNAANAAAAAALQQQQQAQLKKYAQANQMLQSMLPGSKEYEIYMKTMQAYSEMVARGQLGGGGQMQAQKPQQQNKKKAQQMAKGNEASAGVSSGGSSSAYPISTMPRFPNMAFQEQQAKQIFAGLQSSSGSGVSGSGAAPKTLQQKLAERQKANSLLESKSMSAAAAAQQMMNAAAAGGSQMRMSGSNTIPTNVPKQRQTQSLDGGKGPVAPPTQRPKKNPKVDVIILD